MINARKAGLAGRVIIWAGAIGSLAGAAGCEGTYEGDLAGVAAQGIATRTGTPEAAQSAAILGGLAQSSANQQRSMNVAREGRSEVTTEVNVGDAQPNYQTSNQNLEQTTQKIWSDEEIRSKLITDLGLPEAFFCEYYIHEDKWPGAFKKIRNVFRTDEHIRAVSLWAIVNSDLDGKIVTLDVLGEDTNKIVYNVGTIKEDPDNVIRCPKKEIDGVIRGCYTLWSTQYSILANELRQQVGGNRFRAIWNLNGTPQKYADLTIIDAQK